jgi:hypothetical protein
MKPLTYHRQPKSKHKVNELDQPISWTSSSTHLLSSMFVLLHIHQSMVAAPALLVRLMAQNTMNDTKDKSAESVKSVKSGLLQAACDCGFKVCDQALVPWSN